MTALHKWTVTRRREIYRSITFTILRAHLTWAFVAFFSRQIFQPTLVNGMLSHFAITWPPPSIAIYTIRSRSISFYHFYSLTVSLLAYVTQHGIGDAWSMMTMITDDDGHEEVMLTTTLRRGDHVFRAALQQRLLTTTTTTSVMQHTRALLYVVCWITYICCFV